MKGTKLWVVAVLVLVLLACSCAIVSAKCKIKYRKNRQCSGNDYLTRSGSTTMNIRKCAKFCQDISGCRSFSLYFYTEGPPWQETRKGSCALYKDKNPKKIRSKGAFCGRLVCWCINNHAFFFKTYDAKILWDTGLSVPPEICMPWGLCYFERCNLYKDVTSYMWIWMQQ